MIANLTQFADSSSGIGALGIDTKALVIQVITFLLAFWALQHWAFKPIVQLMERRKINQLVVVDDDGKVVGALNMHDLFRAKVI